MADQKFFDDPALDRMMGVIFGLASELHITRSRCRALEGVLVDAGVVAPGAVENWAPDSKRQSEAADDLAAMVKTLFEHCAAGPRP